MFRLLYRHFLRRFFDNELFAAGSDPRTALITVGLFLGAPGLMVAFYGAPGAGYYDPRPLLRAFAVFSGLLVALGTVLQWEALFPDATDHEVLRPLPIPARTILLAKLAALGTLVGGLAVVINGFSAMLIPYLDAPQTGSLAHLWGLIGSQWRAVAATAGIGFFGLLAVQGALICVGGYHALQVIGPRIQALALTVVIAALLMLPLRIYSPATSWAWQPGPRHLALALAALVLLLYVAAFGRFLREQAGAPRRQRSHSWWRFSDRWIARGWGAPRRQAVCRFTLLTLSRSRRHRLVITAWVALAAAVVLASGLDLAGRIHSYRNPYTTDDVERAALAIGFVFVFFLLAGLRYSFTLPSDLGANWIFRVSEGSRPGDLLAGGRLVLLLYLLPVLVPLAPFAIHLWGWRVALWHITLLAMAGAIWVQLLTQRFDKVPFTCSYRPESANFKLRWPAYWIFFTIYAYSFTAWEWRERDRPVWLAAALAMGAATLAALEWERRRWMRSGVRLRFDDRPEHVQSLFTE